VADAPTSKRAALFFDLYRILYAREMKTTLDIDDELLVKAKALSARERKSRLDDFWATPN
jgi:hypothetical protein